MARVRRFGPPKPLQKFCVAVLKRRRAAFRHRTRTFPDWKGPKKSIFGPILGGHKRHVRSKMNFEAKVRSTVTFLKSHHAV